MSLEKYVPKNTLEQFLKELDHEPTDQYWRGWHGAIRAMKQYLKANEARA